MRNTLKIFAMATGLVAISVMPAVARADHKDPKTLASEIMLKVMHSDELLVGFRGLSKHIGEGHSESYMRQAVDQIKLELKGRYSKFKVIYSSGPLEGDHITVAY